MNSLHANLARQVGEVARTFQQQRTGVTPKSVTVVLVDQTLVITLQGALSPAETVLAQSSAGAAQVQEFHRQLFASSSEAFCQEINRIIGVEVLEAAVEVAPTRGTMVHAFASGSMVQVFQLAKRAPLASRDGADPIRLRRAI